MWVKDETGVDKFHENDNQLYQILSNHQSADNIDTWITTPGHLAKAFKAEVPEVKSVTSATRTFGSYGLTSNNQYLNAQGRFAMDNFFQIFSFEMLEGNAKKLFPNKNGIVISDELAMKWYESPEKAIGKTITYESHTGDVETIVSGVFKKLPKNSSIQFDLSLIHI